MEGLNFDKVAHDFDVCIDPKFKPKDKGIFLSFVQSIGYYSICPLEALIIFYQAISDVSLDMIKNILSIYPLRAEYFRA